MIFKLREVFLFVPFRETIFGGKSKMDFHLNKVLQRGKERRGISFVLDAHCTMHIAQDRNPINGKIMCW